MRKLKVLIVLVAIMSLYACKKAESSSDSIIDQVSVEEGTHCADVTYYNPKTGTRNTYSLNVEVENHEVTVIHWPNGGWLDESHFSPQELNRSGHCSFRSDKGYQFDVQIKGPKCSFTDESKMRSDLQADRKAITCPECGGYKEKHENYCNNCIEFAKNACPECGDQKSNYDDLCDYCYKKNHTCMMCGKVKETLSPVERFCPDCLRNHEIYKERYDN